MFTDASFKKVTKKQLDFMKRLKKRWNPGCKREYLNDVKIFSEEIDNFTHLILAYPCKSTVRYYIGVGKRNPNLDPPNPEIGFDVALKRACFELFGETEVKPRERGEGKRVVQEPVREPDSFTREEAKTAVEKVAASSQVTDLIEIRENLHESATKLEEQPETIETE